MRRAIYDRINSVRLTVDNFTVRDLTVVAGVFGLDVSLQQALAFFLRLPTDEDGRLVTIEVGFYSDVETVLQRDLF